MHRHWLTSAAAICLVAAFGHEAAAAPAAAPPVAAKAPDANDLAVRLQRLERDMRDVQAATFRKPPGEKVAPPQPPDVSIDMTVEAPPAPVMPDLGPLLRRIDEFEEGLGRLTGQMEELGHQVDQLSQKTDRLQKQMDLQVADQIRKDATIPEPPRASNELASLNSDKPTPQGPGAPPAVLGKIPADAPLPKADPKREFDSALNLLARARYDEASTAFRAFADSHPDEDRASDALYWTGDIAYSAKKDYGAAARDFAELLKKYPKAQKAPDGMLKLGLALFEMGQAKEACAAVAALPTKYPDAAPAVLTRAKGVRDEKKCK